MGTILIHMIEDPNDSYEEVQLGMMSGMQDAWNDWFEGFDSLSVLGTPGLKKVGCNDEPW